MTVKPFTEASELQAGNGKPVGPLQEIGTSGITAWAGYIRQAYHSELRWPEVYPLFDRLRRSDPEISITRTVFNSLIRSVSFEWQLPDKPSSDDKRAQEFGDEVLDDMTGGYERWRDALIAYIPFMGWGLWEMVPGLRRAGWRPPGGTDNWRSKYDDGLIGIRRMAWRDQSSFDGWFMNDESGRVEGMYQFDIPNSRVLLPFDRCVHVTFGDTESPEGLSPLEAVWRLERIKYGLELVQGIGFEHSAGYLDIVSEKAKLTEADHTAIKKASRMIMSLQEGNYAAWPKGLSGDLKDVNFQAAGSLLEAIRYYGLLKLQLYAMSWMAIASTAGTGSYAAAQDASGMFIKIFNAMVEGFVAQMDDQFGAALFKWNADAFPGMTERPKLIATPIEKDLVLTDLATFVTMFAQNFPVGEDDVVAIRRRSGFLSETLPEEDVLAAAKQPEVDETEEETEEEIEGEEDDTTEPGEEEDVEDEIEDEDADLAFRPVAVGPDEQPTDVTHMATINEKDIDKAIREFKKWAEENDPRLAEWMDAEVKEEEEEE